jgi:hypothetical protein
MLLCIISNGPMPFQGTQSSKSKKKKEKRKKGLDHAE